MIARGLQELIALPLCLLWFWLIDIALRGLKVGPRWFMMHVAGNLGVVACAMPDVSALLLGTGTLSEPNAIGLLSPLALSLHIYHALAFKLRTEDWIHHGLYVFGAAPLIILTQNRAMSVCYFACTGLPGAIDYAALSATKMGILSKPIQRELYSATSAFLRMPLSAVGSLLLFKVGVSGHTPALVLGPLMYINGAHYGRQAIESAAVWRVRRQYGLAGSTGRS